MLSSADFRPGRVLYRSSRMGGRKDRNMDGCKKYPPLFDEVLEKIKLPTNAWSKYHQRHVSDDLIWCQILILTFRRLISQFLHIFIKLCKTLLECRFFMLCHEEVEYRHYSIATDRERHCTNIKVPW